MKSSKTSSYRRVVRWRKRHPTRAKVRHYKYAAVLYVRHYATKDNMTKLNKIFTKTSNKAK